MEQPRAELSHLLGENCIECVNEKADTALWGFV